MVTAFRDLETEMIDYYLRSVTGRIEIYLSESTLLSLARTLRNLDRTWARWVRTWEIVLVDSTVQVSIQGRNYNSSLSKERQARRYESILHTVSGAKTLLARYNVSRDRFFVKIMYPLFPDLDSYYGLACDDRFVSRGCCATTILPLEPRQSVANLRQYCGMLRKERGKITEDAISRDYRGRCRARRESAWLFAYQEDQHITDSLGVEAAAIDEAYANFRDVQRERLDSLVEDVMAHHAGLIAAVSAAWIRDVAAIDVSLRWTYWRTEDREYAALAEHIVKVMAAFTGGKEGGDEVNGLWDGVDRFLRTLDRQEF